jgi:hypothetical protein
LVSAYSFYTFADGFSCAAFFVVFLDFLTDFFGLAFLVVDFFGDLDLFTFFF